MLEEESTTNTTPEKTCEKCGKDFYSKSNLKKHINTVHGEDHGEYPCGMCEKKSAQNYF